MVKWAVAATLLGVLWPAAAQTYRWLDAEGQVHFGDTPPPGVQATPLNVRSAKSKLTDDQARAEVQRLRHNMEAERAREQAIQDRNAKDRQQALLEKAQQLERCEKARWALAALERGRPVYRDEAGLYRTKPPPGQGDAYTGKRDYLDEQQRKAEVGRQRKLARQHCGAEPTAQDQSQTEAQLRHAEMCERAAADLAVFSAPNSGVASEQLNATRSFLSSNCGGSP
jgi:hypothetical protein